MLWLHKEFFDEVRKLLMNHFLSEAFFKAMKAMAMAAINKISFPCHPN
jgi:hypothetical protein